MALTTGQIVGIVIAVVIGLVFLVSYIANTYTLVTKTPDEAEKYLAESSPGLESLKKAITTPFIILIYFLPYFVGFYAVFNDIVTSTFSLSLGVVVGLVLNLINLGVSKFFEFEVNPSDLCGLPGLSWMNAGTIPQGPLFVSTVTAYIATFSTILHGTQSTPAYVSWALWGAFSMAQVSTLLANKTSCGLDTMWLGSISTVVPILLSIVIGLGVGGLTGLYGKNFTGSTSGSSGSPTAPVTSAGGPLGSSTTPPDSNVGTCSAPNDQDQFVCETYKDGKLVTSTVASS